MPDPTDFPPAFLRVLVPTLGQECPYPSQWGNPRNFSDDRRDPGGATMDGIIQIEYDHWRANHLLPLRPVEACTQVEGDDIYFHNYFLPYCPRLQAGIDQSFFDSDVNEGPLQAIKILQFALQVPVDGLWGPQTQTALNAMTDTPRLIALFHARRTTVYTETRNFTTFGDDWLRRNNEIMQASLREVGMR